MTNARRQPKARLDHPARDLKEWVSWARANAGRVNFASGVPAQIYFSAEVADLTGFVLYVNGVAALAYNAPSQFTNTASSTGLMLRLRKWRCRRPAA